MERDGDAGKSGVGGGRKRRGYTMSPAALAQRHTAAWKTGERAATARGQAIPPCTKRHCPMSDEAEKGNCSIKREVARLGGALERCPLQAEINPEVRRRYAEAIEKGELSGLSEHVALLLAGMDQLARSELAETLREGLMIESEVFKDGAPVGLVQRTNPRAEPLLKLLAMLGAEASQQSITPKSAGERKRDEGIGGVLDLYKRRAALAGARAGGE